MSKSNIWYLSGPFHQYREDVKSLAKERGLRIVDANATAGREDAARDVPEVTVRPELTAAGAYGADSGSGDQRPAGGDDLAAVQALVDSLADGELVKPGSGETANRLFGLLTNIHNCVQGLRDQLESEVEKSRTLQHQIDDLLAQAEQARQADAEAKEIAELKAKLDAAKVTYRANASKESLQKQVDELSRA
ncbi:hypothetical protein ACDH60_24065 [Pseudomonas ficuserectae]|uniref:Uncharacterized protein n=2 Tax=Pseudomonas amygdali pv. lachrymans TaxID=53707 RepID=A0AB37QXS7_PSEAV|nr:MULTISPECIES: hypothetical protein [Pseudomonas syringae group genomosp. 2]ARA80253.1 hypothetical protein B5U27_09385 [Pseudomonas amygdali pv. lachrymans]AXH56308.1 hypothetical protein PLA107_014055 [Pseudomonas amygdali pv. lachrymans str. M301315]KKY52732.1 hypothetical protein AAY85_26800 [Pseudomonas amygdali pv. lachrymans]KPB98124.1 Uncharacterized protein AC501_4531 [Pseudomonas amygdali pv. lachrymans]KPC20403.1 Uncharacterized protein AC499_2110 [Pseudomonas amygdali pv. lachrym